MPGNTQPLALPYSKPSPISSYWCFHVHCYRISAITILLTYLNNFGFIPIILYVFVILAIGYGKKNAEIKDRERQRRRRRNGGGQAAVAYNRGGQEGGEDVAVLRADEDNDRYWSRLDQIRNQVSVFIASLISIFWPVFFSTEPVYSAASWEPYFRRIRGQMTKLQRDAFLTQNAAALLVYMPALVICAIVVNFVKSHNYDDQVIFSNMQFNAAIATVIVLGIVSLILTALPSKLDTDDTDSERFEGCHKSHNFIQYFLAFALQQ